MRLRLRVDWIGHVKHGSIRPATFRLVFVCKSPPSLNASKAAPNDLESLPVIDLGYTRFMGVFNEIMAPEHLGLEFQLDINNLASSIWNREPLEGIEGYEGFAVLKAGSPIAIFFVVLDSGGGGWLGFAGLLPRFRRTRVVAAAARCAVETLDRIGAFPLTIEIEFANRSSLQMAERRCGPAQNFVAVYDCPLHGT